MSLVLHETPEREIKHEILFDDHIGDYFGPISCYKGYY